MGCGKVTDLSIIKARLKSSIEWLESRIAQIESGLYAVRTDTPDTQHRLLIMGVRGYSETALLYKHVLEQIESCPSGQLVPKYKVESVLESLERQGLIVLS